MNLKIQLNGPDITISLKRVKIDSTSQFSQRDFDRIGSNQIICAVSGLATPAVGLVIVNVYTFEFRSMFLTKFPSAESFSFKCFVSGGRSVTLEIKSVWTEAIVSVLPTQLKHSTANTVP